MTSAKGLLPVYTPDSKILILGTLPSQTSRAHNAYYANNGNKFWKIICEYLGVTVPDNYEQKIQLLNENNIAVWDLIDTCEIEGSKDSTINNPIYNDLQGLLNKTNIELTAKTISKYFNVPITKYFNIEKKEVKYSKATNAGIRTILVIILGEAKRQQLVEHNYASKDYTRAITGTTKTKEIFDEQESKDFVKAVLKEPHQKKRTIFALLIFLGLRKAEICGLSWSDIDFYNKTLSVNHNSIYFKKFGIVTKGTKTKTSKRTIRLPEQLVTILAEYKSWYDEQKINYGDLWADTDKLFLQDNGNTLNPCTINLWLKKFNLEHGFKNIPPHSLRHTSITMQIKAGVPLKAVSARAGHSSERITVNNQYGHTIINNIIKAVIF